MKSLLISIIIILASSVSANVSASCVIDLKVKKQGAKSFYTQSGEKISKKVVSKLSSQCKFNYKLMNQAEIKGMKIARLTKQLAKLRK